MSFSNVDLDKLKGDMRYWENGPLATRIEKLIARLAAGEAALLEYKGDAEETVLFAKWRESCGR